MRLGRLGFLARRVALSGLAGALGSGAVSCSDSTPITLDGAGGSGGAAAVATTGSASKASSAATGSTSAAGGGGPCPDDVTCVASFPFHDERDTAAEGVSHIDSYDCAPDVGEHGKEIVYRLTLPSDGYLSAAVYDGDGVDIDLQILTSFDPTHPAGTSCVTRGDLAAAADVAAGTVWVIADSWSDSGGTAYPGAYSVDIGFIPVASGPCDMETGEMARVGDGGNHLAMPATGPVAKEAHLVTQAEPPPFPATATDELAAHYALSQQATNLVMHRGELWAPLEGGSFYGAGIGDPADVPVLDEGWYVNMYWTPASRPARGTKMILRVPGEPRAVVVAAGYETGPGDLSSVAGTPEETHYYLGTDHGSTLQVGIASDQSLPLGPRHCQ